MDTAKLLATIEAAEGFSPHGAPDAGGTLQVGYGRNLTTDPLTPAEAAYLTAGPVNDRIAALGVRLPWFLTLDDCRARALTEMAYQLGTHGLLAFTPFLSYVEGANWQAAHDDLLTTLLAKQTPVRAARYAQMILTGTDPA